MEVKSHWKIIIGLGNPDKQYKNTYHNAGFLFIEYLSKYQAPAKCRLLKSSNYMNESGLFAAKAMKKYGAKPEEILIVHDDSDIELGEYKFSFGRGSAGHKGIESIIQSLNTKNFWRLRIGIRKVSGKKADLSAGDHQEKRDLPAVAHRAKAGKFVLKKISKKDLEILKRVFEEISNSFDKIPERF